ncbi:MAG: D-alanyl-D-alanine carboxypeptidase [Alphaproteobacteria bacterium]|nr:D-alanyl-D-alanine carboxypeptidase [Alphaproteobacteria bacterium]
MHRFPLSLLAILVVVWGAAAQAEPIETAARQALLLDYDTGAVLLEKNADDLMPPSSMSKLMTTYMLFERLKEGRVSLEDTMPVSEKAWRMGGSKMFVHIGARVKMDDLLRGIIIQSGNDACIVAAEGVAGSEEALVAEMNKRAREIGLTRSTFRNVTGWPDPQHMTTARDLATLARRLIVDFPEYYRIYSETEFTYGGIKQGNRNPLLYKNMGADGLKTGHTEAAGYGLTGSAKREGRRLILVVNGLTSMKERAEETERLMEWGFREFGNYALFKAGETVIEADTWLGADPRVPLAVERDVTVTMTRAARANMKVVAAFEGPLPTPIAKGTPVAVLVVSAPNTPETRISLVAAANVEKLGFVGRIGAAVRHTFWGPER